jgi:hypothetical protein
MRHRREASVTEAGIMTGILCLISSKMPLVEPQHNVPRQAAMAAAIAGAS